MGVVPITINGVAYPKNKKDKPMPVTIVGYAWIPGLQVPGGGGEHPDHTLPGDLPHPEHPIELPPPTEPPTELPPPEHPLEEMLTLVAKEPPKDGGWGWFPEYGWIYSPGEEAGRPKRR